MKLESTRTTVTLLLIICYMDGELFLIIIATPMGEYGLCGTPEVIDVEVIFESDQLIHVAVKIYQKQISFLASFLYGLHSRGEQSSLWKSLVKIYGLAGNLSWIVMGDFNVVRRSEERVGGNLSWVYSNEDLDI